MAQQELIQDILVREYAKAKSRNPAFSQRAFAKRLGLSSGATSSLMNGKRKISDKMAKRLLESLNINPQEKELALKPQKIIATKRTRKETKLGLDHFETLANPLHFNLLSLLEIESADVSEMAKRLGKSKREVLQAIKRLKRLELIEEVEGSFYPTQEELASPDEIASSSIKAYHLESMEEAKTSLYKDDLTKRDFTSQTLAISLNKIPAVKELIRNFEEQLAELVDQGQEEKEEVYKINVHFYPVTRSE